MEPLLLAVQILEDFGGQTIRRFEDTDLQPPGL